MKKLVLLIMLIMCTSAFSTNVENPHLLTSSKHSDCDDHDDDDDDDDDHDDDDDDNPALPITDYLYIIAIAGVLYAGKKLII